MAVHALEHTLAAFVVDDGKAARRFLEVVQKLDKDDKNVEIVDAAIAERTKRGGVKVHQTKDMGGRKGAVGGATIGVVVGTMLLGPAGPLVGGALGGTLAGLYAKFRDIGIDDKMMKTVAQGSREGQERRLRRVHGQLVGVDRRGQRRDQGRARPADPQHPLARQGRCAP